jgi:uncharacterized coiled-coil DUF342 family protein
MEYIIIGLIGLLILVLFSKGKTRESKLVELTRVKMEINSLLAVVQEYFKAIQEHQKHIDELKDSINLLNAHFIMTQAELQQHFPEVNNKVHIKPKLTLVKLKKEVDKLTKKNKKKEKKNDPTDRGRTQ